MTLGELRYILDERASEREDAADAEVLFFTGCQYVTLPPQAVGPLVEHAGRPVVVINVEHFDREKR